MVRSRWRRRERKQCLQYKLRFLQVAGYTLLLPVQDLPFSADTVTVLLLSSSASAGSNHLRITCLIAVFFLTANAVLCLLGLPFFFFSFFSQRFPLCSYLVALSCTQHPVCTGAGQTLSLCDAEDISQAITFSAWARYLYNWVLPAGSV